MKLLLALTGIAVGVLGLHASATAGEGRCTAGLIQVAKVWLIESQALRQAFQRLEAGDCLGALAQFEMAAGRGDRLAQSNAGLFYDIGLGIEVDLARARHWYQMAAESGVAQAQWNLAVVLLAPYGAAGTTLGLVPLAQPDTVEQTRDYRQALVWAIAAAENGHPAASAGVRRLSETLSPDEVESAHRQAQQYLAP